jgi:hypothetical protein
MLAVGRQWIGVAEGAIWIGRFRGEPFETNAETVWQATVLNGINVQTWPRDVTATGTWRPHLAVQGRANWNATLPAWIPGVVLFGISVVLFRRTRFINAAQCCWNCGYPMAEIAQEPACPECGGTRVNGR